MFNVDSADFRVHIDLMMNALKTRDKAIIQGFEQPFNALLGAKYVMDLVTAAMHQLAVSDLETCHWALKNYYEPGTYHAMRQRAVKRVLQMLAEQGYIRGQDFLVTADQDVLLRRDLKEQLVQGISALDRLLLESIIQVIH